MFWNISPCDKFLLRFDWYKMIVFRKGLNLKIWESALLKSPQNSPRVLFSSYFFGTYNAESRIPLNSSNSCTNSETSANSFKIKLGWLFFTFCVGKIAYDSDIWKNFLPVVSAKSLLEDEGEIEERNKEYARYLEEKNTKEIERLNLRGRYNFIADVVERTAPAVVYIEIKDRRRLDYFGQPMTASNGSGFIVKEDGLIITNAHVVIGRPHSQVNVKLHDGRTFTGRVEHVDLKSDLATVRIPCTGLPTLKLGTSTSVRPGEWVVAMGSPLSLANTITTGVVSSVSRGSSELGLHGKDMDYIQTDAAITFGNSGGPLVNLDGEAIGINAMKVTAGISFAIPVDYAKEFLLATQKDHVPPGYGPPKRRYMGVTLLTLTPQLILELQRRGNDLAPDVVYGVLIWRVALSSPADNAGLQPGDVITMINDKPIRSANDVYKLLEGTEELRLHIVRKREHLKVTVLPEAAT